MRKFERIGLVVVCASLLVISAIVLLLFQYQRDARLAEIRAQGVGIVRTLAHVPFDQVVRDGTAQGIVQLLGHSIGQLDRAYTSIVAPDGRSIHESPAAGVIVPPPQIPSSPAAWLGEHELRLPGDERPVLEFHAPLLQDGDLAGFARIGYFYPSFGLSVSQVPFLATVAMPVFLLVPLFHFLLRREVKPIRAASEAMNKVLESDGFGSVELVPSESLGNFMDRFNGFVDMARSRIETLESDRTRLQTSSKLLAYRKTRIETVLETLPEAVMVLDDSGTITFANLKAAALFDTTIETILNCPPNEWCGNTEVFSLLCKLQQNHSMPNLSETISFRVDTTSDRTISTKSYPLFSPKDPGVSIGTLIVFRDETREVLARRAREDFVAHLSHELKSPLNVLGLYSESLLGEAGQSAEFRIEAANVIAAEVRQLSSLITGLLSMTKIESGSLSVDRSLVKLRELLSSAFEEARAGAGDRDLEFEFAVPKELPPVMVDKDLLRIAIANLLSNAVKYNRPGGSVRLFVEETPDALQIGVRDTGLGISEKDKSRVFEKFYRVEQDAVTAQNGHGLGLALTKQIVELHQGALMLESEVGVGSEFRITLWKDNIAVKQAI